MNYYNEFDPKAAQWLRTLIEYDLIPEGEVDERSIKDVDPWDLHGFTQCHFFCGIGGWPLALQLAGIPSGMPLWTGSCPCQAFSTAGKQLGFKDERDLWPVFFNLIKVCRPPVVLGEQVAAAIGHGWLDRVYHDLEGEGYACGAAVLGAFSVGAPHKRERLYWGGKLEYTSKSSREREPICVLVRESRQAGIETAGRGTDGSVASSSSKGLQGRVGDAAQQAGRAGTVSGSGSVVGWLADTGRADAERWGGPGEASGTAGDAEGEAQQRKRGWTPPWASSIPISCRDGKTRRIPAEAQSVLQCVVNEFSSDLAGCDPRLGFPLEAQGVKNRAVMLKGLGNAIVPQVAAEFIKAFLDTAE